MLVGSVTSEFENLGGCRVNLRWKRAEESTYVNLWSEKVAGLFFNACKYQKKIKEMSLIQI